LTTTRPERTAACGLAALLASLLAAAAPAEARPGGGAGVDAYVERRAEAAGDAKALVKLARWCRRHKLFDEEKEALTLALRADPGQREARGRLDEVLAAEERHRDFHTPWRRDAPALFVETNTSEAKLHLYCDAVSRFFERFGQVFHVRLDPLDDWGTKIGVKVFASEADFKRYQSETGGGVSESAVGYYSLTDKELILYHDPNDPRETLNTLFHEGTHLFMHLTLGEQTRYLPHWLSEGVAEYFGTARFDPVERTLEYGLPAYGRLRDAQAALARGSISLRGDLLEVTSYGAFGATRYALAWSLVHMLVEYERGGRHVFRDRFPAYLAEAIKPGADQVATFEDHFGPLGEVEALWFEYVRDFEMPPLEEGIACLREGDARRAIPLIERRCREAPDDARAHYFLGEARYWDGDTAGAVAAYEAAVAANPEFPRAWAALSWALPEVGRAAEAVRAAERAVEVSPSGTNYYYLANACYEAADLDAARAALRESVRLDGISQATVDLQARIDAGPPAGRPTSPAGGEPGRETTEPAGDDVLASRASDPPPAPESAGEPDEPPGEAAAGLVERARAVLEGYRHRGLAAAEEALAAGQPDQALYLLAEVAQIAAARDGELDALLRRVPAGLRRAYAESAWAVRPRPDGFRERDADDASRRAVEAWRHLDAEEWREAYEAAQAALEVDPFQLRALDVAARALAGARRQKLEAIALSVRAADTPKADDRSTKRLYLSAKRRVRDLAPALHDFLTRKADAAAELLALRAEALAAGADDVADPIGRAAALLAPGEPEVGAALGVRLLRESALPRSVTGGPAPEGRGEPPAEADAEVRNGVRWRDLLREPDAWSWTSGERPDRIGPDGISYRFRPGDEDVMATLERPEADVLPAERCELHFRLRWTPRRAAREGLVFVMFRGASHADRTDDRTLILRDDGTVMFATHEGDRWVALFDGRVPTDGRWHDYALAWEPSPEGGGFSLYVDGAERAAMTGGLRGGRRYLGGLGFGFYGVESAEIERLEVATAAR